MYITCHAYIYIYNNNNIVCALFGPLPIFTADLHIIPIHTYTNKVPGD